jgi:hypothetical protein
MDKYNAQFILEEFEEWLIRGIEAVGDLYDKTVNKSEKLRLLEKYNTLTMVSNKIDELKK